MAMTKITIVLEGNLDEAVPAFAQKLASRWEVELKPFLERGYNWSIGLPGGTVEILLEPTRSARPS